MVFAAPLDALEPVTLKSVYQMNLAQVWLPRSPPMLAVRDGQEQHLRQAVEEEP
jgi:hypothetical protein